MVVCGHTKSLSPCRRITGFFIALLVCVFTFDGTDDDFLTIPRGVSSFAPQVAKRVPPKSGSFSHLQSPKCSMTTTLYLAKDETDCTTGSRYLCLLKDYETVEGPYFSALFDQLFEQTKHITKSVVFLTTQKDLDDLCSRNGDNALNSRFSNLTQSLDLDKDPTLFVLDDWNPMLLESHFPSLKFNNSDPTNENPTVIWLYGNSNAFHTRHLLRTSGFDRWIQENCASSSVLQSDFDNSIFVGEGTGTLCTGATMDSAKASGNDPKGAPELQFYGLQLLGENKSKGVVFVSEEEKADESSSRQYSGLEVCRDDDVWIWAQESSQIGEEQLAINFVMAPNRRGTIEKYDTLEPLAPLIFQSPEGSEGVACYGEPSIDPSRSAQAETIGDSEWWE